MDLVNPSNGRILLGSRRFIKLVYIWGFWLRINCKSQFTGRNVSWKIYTVEIIQYLFIGSRSSHLASVALPEEDLQSDVLTTLRRELEPQMRELRWWQEWLSLRPPTRISQAVNFLGKPTSRFPASQVLRSHSLEIKTTKNKQHSEVNIQLMDKLNCQK